MISPPCFYVTLFNMKIKSHTWNEQFLNCSACIPKNPNSSDEEFSLMNRKFVDPLPPCKGGRFYSPRGSFVSLRRLAKVLRFNARHYTLLCFSNPVSAQKHAFK